VAVVFRLVYYTIDEQPDLVGVPVGAFADSAFPRPKYSVYEPRRHPWVAQPEGCVEDSPGDDEARTEAWT
jgi:hypothetical protein